MASWISGCGTSTPSLPGAPDLADQRQRSGEEDHADHHVKHQEHRIRREGVGDQRVPIGELGEAERPGDLARSVVSEGGKREGDVEQRDAARQRPPIDGDPEGPGRQSLDHHVEGREQGEPADEGQHGPKAEVLRPRAEAGRGDPPLPQSGSRRHEGAGEQRPGDRHGDQDVAVRGRAASEEREGERRLQQQDEEVGGDGNRRDGHHRRDAPPRELKDAVEEAGVRHGVVHRSQQLGASANRDQLAGGDRRHEAPDDRRLEDPPPEEEDHLVRHREAEVEREVRSFGGPDQGVPVGREAEDVAECRRGDGPREELAPERGSEGRHRAAE